MARATMVLRDRGRAIRRFAESGLHYQAAVDAATVPEGARQAIRAANAEWLPALQKQDATKIAEPYADDGVFVTATGETVRGRRGIEQLMRDRFATRGRLISGTLMQEHLTRVGNRVYEWGRAETEAAVEGAAPIRSTGRYLTVWEQDAHGRWCIVRNLSITE